MERDDMMALPKANYRKNPPGMLRHLWKIDLIKTLRHKFSAKVRELFQRFPDNLPVGTPAADFTLQTVSGEKISLSDYRGKKHVVLEFGSFT
jgi:hypothetical protein